MGALLAPNPIFRAWDNNNNPLVGGQVWTYQAGTTTPAATYTDSTAGTANPNPVPLNARGEAAIWLLPTQAYKFVLEDANGNLIWTEDQITSPAPVAVGNMTDEKGSNGQPGFSAANGDFTPGTTMSLTLSKNYGSASNLWVAFDAAEQGADTFSLSGTTLAFNSPIPIGTNKVYVKGGTSLAIGTVSDSSVAAGSKLYNRITDLVDVKDLGALGNGANNDSGAFSANVSAFYIGASSGNYLINQNTTITADMWFMGGVITVPSGVTLTINGSVIAPSKVIFQGAGTVVINRGVIDVAWFDGTDASSKWTFCARGIQNSNGTGKTVAFYPPDPNDAWATTSLNNQWGYGWLVTAPIDIEQTQAYTTFLTYTTFIVKGNSVSSVWQFGTGTNKADGLQFPLPLRVDGGNGLATWSIQIEGSSHSYFAALYLYYCGGVALTPNGNKQVSDISIGYIDTGELYGQAVLMDGTNGANNTITDIDIGLVSSTGFVSGHAADSVVKIGSNCNAISVRRVSHRAVVGNFVDATNGVVLITNGGTLGSNLVSCRYGINIGPVINGSTTQTAECVVTSDASGGAAAKMTGITIEAGSQNDTGSPPGGSTISLNYTNGTIVQGMPGASSTNMAQHVTVNATCSDTQIYGVTPSQVTDGGTNTLINGHNYGAITPISAPASGAAWVNNNHFPVLFQIQGATAITGVVYTRGSTALTLATSGTAGAWPVAPGDNIATSYTGSPSFNYIPI
jgi:hypothetical protein